ncbi:MAG: sulfatase [Pirellulaceae bacterium]|nr:MAG: sulfatase [Pirellulaceae bacterium]
MNVRQQVAAASLQVARRWFLSQCGVGLGAMALQYLLSRSAHGDGPTAGLLPQRPHFPPRAKAVIHLFMAGAPSQLELFDYKPLLSRLQGQPLPPSIIGDQRYAFIQSTAGVLGPQYPFRRYGDSGAELSSAIPYLQKVVDRLCIVKSMHTDQFNHAPAQIFFNSGFAQPGRPCFGAWVVYGLGAETDALPAFVVMSTGDGLSGGAALWSSGFLPTRFSGVPFRNQGDPILNVSTPAGIPDQLQHQTYATIGKLNRRRFDSLGDPEIMTSIANFEMAARMQVSAPELMDLRGETQETLDLYGCHPDQPSFARACLLARRMVERGVRFINIYHSGWDAHSNVAGNIRNNCRKTDQASAALVLDLARRGLLDETLVIWGGEFGRTPMVETNPALGRALGRDHHPQAFTIWMAGGGVRPGETYGATDDFGFHIIENPVHVHDLHATLLHCLGFDHTRLTYHHAGRDFRLTDVHGRVIRDLLV